MGLEGANELLDERAGDTREEVEPVGLEQRKEAGAAH
jgi:hypothetical protein